MRMNGDFSRASTAFFPSVCGVGGAHRTAARIFHSTRNRASRRRGFGQIRANRGGLIRFRFAACIRMQRTISCAAILQRCDGAIFDADGSQTSG
jgi:hypothetical protein